MSAVAELAPSVGVVAATDALGVSRASFYRWKAPAEQPDPGARPRGRVHRRLTDEEREAVFEVLHSEEFVDMAPAAINAALLDRGTYLCSTRTMYRLLRERDEVRDRRNQRRHPKHEKPELAARAPNRVWSWDITKLRGPHRGVHYSLYVIIDIYSRYIVAWTIAPGEDAVLAKDFIAQACLKQAVQPRQLVIHSDRGSSMRSKAVCDLLADLEVARSHSRPHVSDDNPYSESQFKTLKYRPEFPDRFGSLEDARAFCRRFFDWYNREHRHAGICMLSPHVVHYGQAEETLERRHQTKALAYAAHPERFPGGPPARNRLPEVVWINQPVETPQPLADASPTFEEHAVRLHR